MLTAETKERLSNFSRIANQARVARSSFQRMGSLQQRAGADFGEDALKDIDIPLPPHLVGYEIKRGGWPCNLI
jgi:hypothetical protein